MNYDLKGIINIYWHAIHEFELRDRLKLHLTYTSLGRTKTEFPIAEKV